MVTTLAPVKTYTIEEFMALPDDGNRYELVEGELVEMGQPGVRHGIISSRLHKLIANYADANDLGEAFLPMGFKLAPKTVRAPDVAFVVKERALGDIDGAAPVPPDLAVEVVTPSDKLNAIEKKIKEYQKAGVALVWVIRPFSQVVEVYHPTDNKPVVFGIEDELNGVIN